MLDYLRETIGLSAVETAWKDEASMPRFLRSKRKYSVLTIDKTSLLLIHVKEEEFNLQTYLKQMEKLKAYWPGEMVLHFDRLSNYQRKALVKQRLSFIISNSQVYIPRLGILLQEQQAPAASAPKKHFSAGTQLVFLYMLYHADAFPMTKTELARCTASNAMKITRAIQELKQIELVHCHQAGRADYVSPVCTGEAFWKKGKDYLINPVRKKVYVRNDQNLTELPVSGETALAEMSMLAKPAVSVYAIDQASYKTATQLVRIDPAWEMANDYIQLEVWAYDPYLFAQNGRVDPVSLYASLKDVADERVEEAIDEMMEGYRW